VLQLGNEALKASVAQAKNMLMAWANCKPDRFDSGCKSGDAASGFALAKRDLIPL
jgi:hypothetical protein